MKGNKLNTLYLRDKYGTYDYRAYSADLQRRLTNLIFKKFSLSMKQCSNIVTLIIGFYQGLALKGDNEYLMFPKIRAENGNDCIYLYRFYKSCGMEFEFKYQINCNGSIIPLGKVNERKAEKGENNILSKKSLNPPKLII